MSTVTDSLSAAPVTRFPYHDATLGAAFADVARRHPEAAAVVTDQAVVTYHQLALHAGGIATRLASAPVTESREGPGPVPRVGLLLEHGADMIAAILGSLAAGWCYVPLDPTYPVERLRAMATQAGLAVVFTHRHLHDLAAHLIATTAVVAVDELPPAPLSAVEIDPRQPAYVLFTSGSTGRPKGVTHSHRSVLHGITNHVDNLRLGPGDRTSLVTPFSYDMSVSDLYGAVLSGAAVAPVDLRRHGVAYLADALVQRRVTVYHSTPTVFRYVVDRLVEAGGPGHRLPDVRVVLLGGEPATRADLALARAHCSPECRFVNGYGATEVSFTVQLQLPAGTEPPGDPQQQVLPIGTALPGYEPLLLDPAGRPLPDDATGPAELAIRSDYLGLGYWAEPAQTAERFSADGTLYRTGDVVRRLPDGTLSYLGRADRQVKINGHRVELGEVEAQLAELPGVARAAVVARPGSGPAAASQLHGYVQPRRGAAGVGLEPGTLRAALAERLPAYLLPHRVSVVAELPLTASGKVDFRALPEPAAAPVIVPTQSLPAGATEQLVARAWCEVLAVPAVGRLVNFFDAGGDSLTLNRLQLQLAAATGVEVPLVRLLEHPTVAAMARHLEARVDDAGSALDHAAGRMAQRRGAIRARNHQDRQRGRGRRVDR